MAAAVRHRVMADTAVLAGIEAAAGVNGRHQGAIAC